MRDELEGLAAKALDDVGLGDDDAVDAEEVAACHGMWLEPVAGGRAWVDGDVIAVPMGVRLTRRNRLVAHELAHPILRASSLPNTEQNADALAAAILLPRRALDRSLRRLGWDLEALRARHPLASTELIARRIAELREAWVTIVERGRIKTRIASPGLPAPPARLTRMEREVLERAESELRRVDSGLVSATPVFDGEWRRIVLIADQEQLSLRF